VPAGLFPAVRVVKEEDGGNVVPLGGRYGADRRVRSAHR